VQQHPNPPTGSAVTVTLCEAVLQPTLCSLQASACLCPGLGAPPKTTGWCCASTWAPTASPRWWPLTRRAGRSWGAHASLTACLVSLPTAGKTACIAPSIQTFLVLCCLGPSPCGQGRCSFGPGRLSEQPVQCIYTKSFSLAAIVCQLGICPPLKSDAYQPSGMHQRRYKAMEEP